MKNATRFRSDPTPPSDAAGVICRAAGDAPQIRDERRLVFYPAVFNRYSRPITEGGRTFREVIRPGAFTATLAAGVDVYACIEHAKPQTFATRAGGLLLAEDPRGLFASCYLEAGTLGDQVLADVRAGVYRGCSFAFRTVSDRWTEPVAGGPPLPLCELLAVDLVDVTLTRNPAYLDTVFSVRSAASVGRDRRLRLLKLRA
jgi:HK97 family phage prohead protease